ncbi:hypothetical protein Tco_0560541 [Tanacetum coccineum]
MASQAIHDAITTHQVTASHHFMTASARTDSNADLEDSSYDGVTTKMRRCHVLEKQLLSASLLICLGKRDCVKRIPSGITIELPEGNKVVPLRSDTIRLVQNGCSFHGLRSEDPSQHLKDFPKLVDSLDLDGENRERMRLRYFYVPYSDSASNWLLNALYQQDPSPHIPRHGIDLWLQVQIFYNHVNPITRRTIDQSIGGKLRDLNPEESWAILEDLALYDNESWNDPRDFAKSVKAITLPQDVPSTSDRRLIELENQVQRFMEAHLAPTQSTQVYKKSLPRVKSVVVPTTLSIA